jgi:hypothetical protein
MTPDFNNEGNEFGPQTYIVYLYSSVVWSHLKLQLKVHLHLSRINLAGLLKKL